MVPFQGRTSVWAQWLLTLKSNWAQVLSHHDWLGGLLSNAFCLSFPIYKREVARHTYCMQLSGQ